MVLIMLQYIHNSIIIIVTNIMLEFLSAHFVHPGALQLTIFSLFSMGLEHKYLNQQLGVI